MLVWLYLRLRGFGLLCFLRDITTIGWRIPNSFRKLPKVARSSTPGTTWLFIQIVYLREMFVYTWREDKVYVFCERLVTWVLHYLSLDSEITLGKDQKELSGWREHGSPETYATSRCAALGNNLCPPKQTVDYCCSSLGDLNSRVMFTTV